MADWACLSRLQKRTAAAHLDQALACSATGNLRRLSRCIAATALPPWGRFAGPSAGIWPAGLDRRCNERRQLPAPGGGRGDWAACRLCLAGHGGGRRGGGAGVFLAGGG